MMKRFLILIIGIILSTGVAGGVGFINNKEKDNTINSPKEKGLDHDEIKRLLFEMKSIQYFCMSDEIGLETQTPHTHVFVLSKSPIRFSTLKRRFGEAHIEEARGSAADNKAYIEKSGKWTEDAKA